MSAIISGYLTSDLKRKIAQGLALRPLPAVFVWQQEGGHAAVSFSDDPQAIVAVTCTGQGAIGNLRTTLMTTQRPSRMMGILSLGNAA